MVDEAPWWEKYGLEMQTPICRLDEIAEFDGTSWVLRS